MTINTAAFVAGNGIPRADVSIDAATAAGLLRGHGALIIQNALSPEKLAELQDATAPWYDQAPVGEGQFFGRRTRRFGGVFSKVPQAADLAAHTLVAEIMDLLLKGDPERPVCNMVDLSAVQAIGIEPGEPGQFLHRDEELWPFPHEFEIMANAMWCIGDFTAQNGATRMIPGSHLWARDRMPEIGEAVQAEAPAGSVILWVGGLLHGGGPNTSGEIRRGLVASYKLGWLAPQEKLLVSVPPELARSFSEPVKRRIGYALHKPNLGWIEGRDPYEWIEGRTGALAAASDNLTEMHEGILADLEVNPDRYAPFLA